MTEEIRKGRRQPPKPKPAKKTGVLVIQFEFTEDEPYPFDAIVDTIGKAIEGRGLERRVKGTWGAIDSAAEGVLTVVREWRT